MAYNDSKVLTSQYIFIMISQHYPPQPISVAYYSKCLFLNHILSIVGGQSFPPFGEQRSITPLFYDVLLELLVPEAGGCRNRRHMKPLNCSGPEAACVTCIHRPLARTRQMALTWHRNRIRNVQESVGYLMDTIYATQSESNLLNFKPIYNLNNTTNY